MARPSRLALVALLVAALLGTVLADTYMMFPPGSNNRCDERSNNRNNANRLFDSQNNAAGGYQVCDREYRFYEDTEINIEWTTQHGCGNGASNKADNSVPESVGCQQTIQIGCEDTFRKYAGPQADSYRLTDGISLGRGCADRPSECPDGNMDNAYKIFGNSCTQTHPTTGLTEVAYRSRGQNIDQGNHCPNGFSNSEECNNLDLSNSMGTFNSNTCRCSTRKQKTFGVHEPEMVYAKCICRDRNLGLFVADRGSSNVLGATRTRENPGGARYGFQCAEEANYAPYWHCTPWMDVAYVVSDTSRCDFYRSESQNVKDKCECVPKAGDDATLEQICEAQRYNTAVDCTTNDHKWKCDCKWNIPAPDCIQAPWQPDNRLGNTLATSRSAEELSHTFSHYKWHIPRNFVPKGMDERRCVLRIRYNITNAEVPHDFDYTNNDQIKNNPVYVFGTPGSSTPTEAMPLRLAINTAQFGRTFEDRSYVFVVAKRPSNLKGARIHNINVRGKRGNIAQVRNCVEYNFTPDHKHVNVGDYIHFQWCLTEYDDPNNAGNGLAGTGRANVVPIHNYASNIFQNQAEEERCRMFTEEDERRLAWLDQTECLSVEAMLQGSNDNNNIRACQFLNGVRDPETKMPTAYFSHVAKVQKACSYKYISTRNNDFSNRAQKGVINATPAGATLGMAIGISIGAIVVVGAIVAVGVLVYTGKMTIGNFGKKV
ncbi:hypothetical protein H696_04001 [Fonticula alba]|uniref:Uncharacterized protein n=1 Tax=Fonticula alba TaxID=691883 RepID=A0A058Z5M6_FONAL|nr:hypothetical protein H696_04001 [Fonticula alba]KCV69579.1 hypothetical protein H696_04001 [Fonticula alba]|eukprot:XP_009496144.1 hypothetical protein H696_04001 [Fonticula alba]